MIKAAFFYNDDNMTGFTVSGHGTADGQDTGGRLVCAAVSSAAYMAANTITEILKDTPEIKLRDGFMSVKKCNSELCRVLLSGLRLHIFALSAEYPHLITITEEKNYA